MRNKISIEEFVSYPIKRHFVYTEQVLVPMIRLILERGDKTNPCKENRFHVICVECVKRPKSSYSSLWVNGSYVTNFNSTASSGSDQRITLGNVRDGGDIPILGIIAAMEIYACIIEGVPGPIKEEIERRERLIDRLIDSFIHLFNVDVRDRYKRKLKLKKFIKIKSNNKTIY